MQQAQLPAIKEVRPEYAALDAQMLQDVLQRLDRAFRAFFRRVKAGQTPGYPRFKSRDRYNSFTFKQTGWNVTAGCLVIRGLGSLKVRWSRPLLGTVKTVTVKRDADAWYVTFSCVVDVADPVAEPALPAIGIDLGLEHFLSTSDGEHVANPRYFRTGEDILARRQQALARKKRGSARRKKAKLLVTKAHRKVWNQRRDFHHKTAQRLVQGHGLIAVEDLHIANMARNPSLAKSISDAGWGQFIAILTQKAEEAAVVVIAVPPAGTSQSCSGCGRTALKGLSERWHTCEHCGCSLQRDVNAARNILARAGQAPQTSLV